ncbi:MAG TPA: ATP-binding protein [Burkholderiaceae bacterium]|nr:ATP-binding protein [Burkholderiaceae bacterium]
MLAEFNEIRQSEQRYALVIDATDEAFWDWNVAGDEFYLSPRLIEMLGFPRDATFAGRGALFERLSIPPEDRQALDSAAAEHFAGKTRRMDIEFRVLVRGEDRWMHAIGCATRDSAGEVVRWNGALRDVTARRRAEQSLRQSEEALCESEQRYELAMAASESGYWDWHVSTDRYFFSPKAYELGGYPPGTTWASRDELKARINMHPEDFARWEAAREQLFAGTGERLAMEVRYIVRGETRWHMLQGICKRDDTGKVIRWSGSATDITQRKLAEEELQTTERKLRQAQRLESMGAFAGGIAHDFNNILGAILGFGEMALRDAQKGSRLARDLESIMVAGERGRALVGRLLTFSRSVVGERVPVHVERVVREALDVVSAKLPASVVVHAELRAGSAAILGDATQVHQVVTNLATNAIQAMPAGGALRVALANARVEAPRPATIGGLAAGEYVVLTVADTGAGIAPEIVERIFDPFFTTKGVGTGTGLGLSLVHGIVTELGGGIELISKVGTGTTFTVYLPRSGEIPEVEDDAQLALPRGEGQRVLVVDDEEPLVALATRTLDELGYAPVGFTSSRDALAALRADPQGFDALITDERMPGVSGSALIREVRGLRNSMPVVLMSGYLGPTADKVRASGMFWTLGMAQKAAAALGADEVLQKPVSARDLATSLARVLRL